VQKDILSTVENKVNL